MSAPDDLSTDARALLDAAPCGLMCTTPDGTFLRVNRMFCSWVGYSEPELVHKRKFQDLLSVGGRIFHQTHWAPLLAMQGSISEVKLETEVQSSVEAGTSFSASFPRASEPPVVAGAPTS